MQDKVRQRQQMFSLVEQWQQSGLSQKQYSLQNNITYHVFHYWYKRYRQQSVYPAAGFVPLSVAPTASSGVEVCYPDGKRIIF